jgi:hypothetical protein
MSVRLILLETEIYFEMYIKIKKSSHGLGPVRAYLCGLGRIA